MGKTKTLTDKQKQIIIREYVDNKRGQLYCSKAANCSQYLVKKFLRESDIKIRNFSEAAIVSNQNRAKIVNHNYFDIQSSNMAWLLGFLASDGCVDKKRNRIIINLSLTDKEILEKIKQEVEIENKITEYENVDGFSCVSLAWTSQKHKQVLEKYSIVPNKTFILKPPYLLEEKFKIDYIRGYFDGDGSVSKNCKNLRWQVGGASKEVIEFIVNTLEEYGIPKVNIQTQNFNNNSPFYYCQYSTNATKKIYKILYTKNSLYLKRKKDKFDSLI